MSGCTVDLTDWLSIVRRVGEVVDLEATARQFGALQRVRKIRRASDLLRLAMMYGPGLLSLRGTAAMAADGEVVSLSDKGVLGRLRRMGDWLEHVLQRLLEDRCGFAADDPLRLSLVDGSVICAPGALGTDWRLHARFDPGRGRFGDLVLTRGKVAERVERTRIEPGTTVVQDRGYARVRDFQAVLAAGADFVTRTGWRAVRLADPHGRPVDVIALLRDDRQAAEHVVQTNGMATPLRLITQRLPDCKAETQIKRLRRRASKQGNVLDPRSVAAASHLILLTSLPSERHPLEQVLRMYRDRWQVELGFKRLKTLGGIDRLPALDPALARTWLLAQLIAAVLTDDIASEIIGFPPSGQEPPDTGPDGLNLASLEVRPPDPARRHLATKTHTAAPA